VHAHIVDIAGEPGMAVSRYSGIAQVAAVSRASPAVAAPLLRCPNAASHWLDAQPPNLEEVRRDLGFIVESGVRAGAVINRIRALVKRRLHGRIDWRSRKRSYKL